MPSRSEAEEHLRAIRSLMEKATIYRAISVPAAAIGGALAISASFAFGSWLPNRGVATPLREIHGSQFITLWVGVLLLAAGINVFFLWREARKRGDHLISPGMKLALSALLPSYIVAAFLTWALGASAASTFVVPVWMICHGLGLLATAHFAPRSLMWLGWAFLLAGCGSVWVVGVAFGTFYKLPFSPEINGVWARNATVLIGQMLMALTFGLFHLIYAACTWPRKGRAESQSGAQA